MGHGLGLEHGFSPVLAKVGVETSVHHETALTVQPSRAVDCEGDHRCASIQGCSAQPPPLTS